MSLEVGSESIQPQPNPSLVLFVLALEDLSSQLPVQP